MPNILLANCLIVYLCDKIVCVCLCICMNFNNKKWFTPLARWQVMTLKEEHHHHNHQKHIYNSYHIWRTPYIFWILISELIRLHTYIYTSKLITRSGDNWKLLWQLLNWVKFLVTYIILYTHTHTYIYIYNIDIQTWHISPSQPCISFVKK